MNNAGMSTKYDHRPPDTPKYQHAQIICAVLNFDTHNNNGQHGHAQEGDTPIIFLI